MTDNKNTEMAKMTQKWQICLFVWGSGKSEDLKIWRSEDPKIRRSKDPKIQRSEDPKIRRSEGPKVQRSKGPKIQRSKGPKIQRFHLRSHQKRIKKWPEPKKVEFLDQVVYRFHISMDGGEHESKDSVVWGLWADLQVYLEFVRKALKWKFW